MGEINAIQLERALTKMPVERSVFIWGPPGVGKSDIVRQCADKLGLPLIDVRLPLLDPTDLRGLPFLKDGEAVWARPVFIPDEKRHGDKGILLLDEINAAPPAVQCGAYQLTLDRRLGEHAIPAGWRVWCAGNREGDRAVTYRLPTPLATRLVHLELTPELESWKRWAYGRVNELVIGFLSWRSDLLFKFDPTKYARSFPTPRTWTMASDILGAFSDEDEAFLRTMVGGCVGDGPAAEFIAYMKMARELPTPEDIMEKGAGVVPEDPATKYAVCTSIAGYIARKEKAGAKLAPMLDRMVSYAMLLPEEFSVMLVTDCLSDTRKPILQESRAFIKWAAKFKLVITT